MVRIREILDPELRQRVLEMLAEDRGVSPSTIPDWFELDDADYSDILIRLNEDRDERSLDEDPRM